MRRLGFDSRISLRLPASISVPAPGQGIIAIEIRENDERVRQVVTMINDAAADAALVAERTLVAALGGGCQAPIGAKVGAQLIADGAEQILADARNPKST